MIGSGRLEKAWHEPGKKGGADRTGAAPGADRSGGGGDAGGMACGPDGLPLGASSGPHLGSSRGPWGGGPSPTGRLARGHEAAPEDGGLVGRGGGSFCEGEAELRA